MNENKETGTFGVALY